MKLKNFIAVAVMAAATAPAFALDAEQDLTSEKGDILVKNNFGECVKVNANQNLTDCGASAPAPAPAPVETETVIQTEVITLDADTYFDFDKSVLKEQGKQTIQALANDLNSRGASMRSITVVGHTDSKGSDAYNQKLSERRAQSVVNYLVANGVNRALIHARGDGERYPVASNDTAAGRAKNRRVVITVDGEVQREIQQTVIQ